MNKEKIMSWVNSHKMLSVFIGVIVFVILFSAITPSSTKPPVVTENKVTTEQQAETTQTKEEAIAEWDALVEISKSAKIIYKDDKEYDAYHIYVDKNWYTMKVDEKKNMVAKFSMVKKVITGYYNIKFKDSNTGELVAEVKPFDQSIQVYK